MSITRNTEPKARYSSPRQAGLAPFTDAEAQTLTEMTNFYNDLGINSNHGAFEASYIDPNSGEKGTPRVFFTVPGANGVEEVKNLHDAGMQNWWGKDFWNLVQTGNVFVYPARSEKPCQLQLGKDEQGNWELSISRPLEAADMPKRVTPKPNGWQRFWNKIYSGFYKDVCQAYDKREQSAQSIENSVAKMEAKRKRIDKSREADKVTKAEDHKKQMELDKLRRKDIAPVATEAENLRDNSAFMKNIYGMEAPKTGLSPYGINAKGSQEEIRFNARQRNFTDKYTLDVGFVDITSDDFGSLAYFNTEDTLKVTETLSQPKHGGAEGAKLVEDTVYQARNKVSKAMKKDHDYKGIVFSVRDGINNAVDMFTNKPFPDGKFTEAQKTAMKMGTDLSKFMDKVKKDEDLYTQVERELGGEKVWNKDQEMLKGFNAFLELDKKRTEAKMSLIDSQYTVKETLSAFNKKHLMMDIIKADIAEKIMTGELSEGRSGFTRGLPGNEYYLTEMAEQVIDTTPNLNPSFGGADLVKRLGEHDYSKSIVSLATKLEEKDAVKQNGNNLNSKQPEVKPVQPGF